MITKGGTLTLSIGYDLNKEVYFLFLRINRSPYKFRSTKMGHTVLTSHIIKEAQKVAKGVRGIKCLLGPFTLCCKKIYDCFTGLAIAVVRLGAAPIE